MSQTDEPQRRPKLLPALIAAGVAGLPIVGYLAKGAEFGSFVLLAMLVGVVVFRFDEVSELSFGLLTAKMRERLRESKALLNQMRKLAVISSQGLLDLAGHANRFAPDDRTWSLELRNKIRTNLQELGASETEISAAESRWRTICAGDYVIMILGINQPTGLGEAASTEWKELRRLDAPASPERLAEWLSRNGLLDADGEARIASYKHFLATGEVGDGVGPFHKDQYVNWAERKRATAPA